MKKTLAMVLCVIMMALALTVCGQAEEEKQLAAAKVGDTVTLGSYEQDGDTSNGAEPIEWIVLEDKGGGEYLLISKYCLEAKPYNGEREDITWETCSLRKWLNGEFYELAFTEDEKKLIAQTTVKNDDNPSYGTEGGVDTQDYVYLLSLDEVSAYFVSNEECVSVATAHALENGAYVLIQEDVTIYQSYYDYPLTVGAGAWWLRSPGILSYDAAYVHDSGYVSGIGNFVDATDVCARPVVVTRLVENGTVVSTKDAGTTDGEDEQHVDQTEETQEWKVGDTVTLGSYDQDGDDSNGAEAIEWIVLEDKGDGEYLLIAKYGIEAKAYNEEYTDITWETCSLRAWLNGEFYETAFMENEKKLIAQTNVKNDDNPEYGTEGGNDTQDYVYLLSLDEVYRYFANGDARVCYTTYHAVESGASTNSVGAGWWWLRSPGDDNITAASVGSRGYVFVLGDYVYYASGCVRPVIVARLQNF